MFLSVRARFPPAALRFFGFLLAPTTTIYYCCPALVERRAASAAVREAWDSRAQGRSYPSKRRMQSLGKPYGSSWRRCARSRRCEFSLYFHEHPRCPLHLVLTRLCPAHGMIRVWVLSGEQHDFSVPSSCVVGLLLRLLSIATWMMHALGKPVFLLLCCSSTFFRHAPHVGSIALMDFAKVEIEARGARGCPALPTLETNQ